MQIIGKIIEKLMGDKYKSRYNFEENTEYFIKETSGIALSILNMQDDTQPGKVAFVN